MAQKVIFPEQTIQSKLNTTLGLYYAYLDGAVFVLNVGESYTVIWDGVEHECIAQDGSAIEADARFIGDATAFGLSGNGEPFIIGGTSTSDTNFYCLKDTEETAHTVAIYQTVESSGGADIVLRDRSGNQITYPGIERIKLNTVDGGTVEFVDEGSVPEAVENVPIALDFSGGNQTITAPDGTLVKSAIIEQPANLIPGNIAEGVDIAGIVGTLAAGGIAAGIEYTLDDAGNVIGVTPYGVTSVPYGMCYGMKSLKWVDLSHCLIDSIGQHAFYGCSSLESITIPETVKSLSSYVFRDCTALKEISLPSGLTQIGTGCFYNCSAVESIDIPNGITELYGSTFGGCKALTSITIPASVKKLNTSVFANCTALTAVTFEDTSGWYVATNSSATSGVSVTVSSPSSAASLLTGSYVNYYWFDKT